MIIRMIVKLELEDDEGKVIKTQEYGRAYLENMDMAKAAGDWWRTTYHNFDNPHNKKKFPWHCARISRILDILTNGLKKTMLDKFLCDREAIYKEYKNEL